MAKPHVEFLEIRRLLTTLTPDVTWGQDGYVDRTQGHAYVGASAGGFLTMTPSDGESGGRPPETVERYTADGKPDPSFAVIRIRDTIDAFVDTAGRPLIGVGDEEGKKLTLTRYTVRGRVDKSFGDNGAATLSLAGDALFETPQLIAVAIAPDGSVYAVVKGSVKLSASDTDVGEVIRIFKLTDAGQADATYGAGGSIKLSAETYIEPTWIGVDSAGRLLVATDTGDTNIYRYKPDGSRDKSFGVSRHRIHVTGNVTDTSFAIDAQDRLLIASSNAGVGTGAADTDRLARYDTAGRPDATFGDGGVFTRTQATDEYAEASGVLPQRNGKVIVQLGEHVVGLRADGVLDPAFGTAGVYDVLENLGEGSGNLIAQLRDGSLLTVTKSAAADGGHASVSKLAPRVAAAVGDSGILYLTGTPGDDTFHLRRSGAGTLVVDIGGAASQTFNRVPTGVRVDLGDGANVFVDNYFTAAAVGETVLAGDGNDSIVTGGGADSIDSGDGDDTVSSGDGTDTVDLGGGSNTLDAGSGGGSITAFGTAADLNTVTGTGGTWTLELYETHNHVTLTGDSAYVNLQTGESSVIDARMTVGATVTGSDGNDSITTGSGNDRISTRDGSDTVNAGPGDDTVGGDEFESTGNTSDHFDLGPGNDVARDGYGDNTILGGDGNDSIRTGGGNDSISGGLGRDTLRGGDGRDTLDGGGGADRLFGQAGNDALIGGSANDLLVGGLGDDTLIGNAGNDLIAAGDLNAARVPAAHNRIDGGTGTDAAQTESDLDDLASVETLIATVT